MRDLERPQIWRFRQIRSWRSRMMRRDYPRGTLVLVRPCLGDGAGAGGVPFGSAGPRGPRRLGTRLRLAPFRRPVSGCPFRYWHLSRWCGRPGCRGSGWRRSRLLRRCQRHGSRAVRNRMHQGLRRLLRGHLQLRPLLRGHLQDRRTGLRFGGGPLRLLGPGLRWMQVPHPGGYQDFILFRERRHPAPGPRFGDVPELRAHQLRQALVFYNWPRRQPGEHSRRKDVKPYQVMIKRQADSNEEYDVRNGDPDKNADPGDRQRCWQPKII